ncbi:MAG: Calx-beta domain-containing protein, partial [Verrucomicrobiota bacterium]
AFEFTAGAYQADENGTYGYVTVRRVGGTSGPNADGSGNILLNLVTSNGSAVAGVNYFAINTNLSFPPGEVLQVIAIPVIDDLAIKTNLTVNVAISNPTSPAGLGDQSTAVLTIINTDSSVSFSSSVYTVPKNIFTGEAVIDIVRQGSTSGSASVTFATTTNGTAVTNLNYFAATQTVTFLPGETLKSVAVPVIDNGIPEGNKTVSLALSDAIGAGLGNPSTATLTILDTVVAPGLLSLESSSYVVAEGDGVVTISVLRTGGSSGNVSVDYTTVPGTAVNGVNYFTANGSLNFIDGQTNRTFTVPLIDNSLVQGGVSFSVQLSNPTAGALLLSPTNATVTITENDEALAVVPSGSALITESNPNSIIDTNETVTMAFAFRVSAGTNLTSLTAKLLETNGVTAVSPPVQDYGTLAVRGPSASRSFSFSVDPTYTNGQPIAATFELSEAGHYLGTTQFNFVLGSSTKTFSNANAIVITDNTNATPYPSTIVVSGVGAALVKATVSLNKVVHTWPADVDVLMQAPNQQKILLMANAGSGNQVNNLNLTFDDTALGFLPSGLIASGSYRPTAYLPITTFPAPAPAGPYSTNLSTLNGNNPNGTWSLFVMDDSPFNAGSISNGWSLTLSTLAVVSSSADVGVSVTASANTVALGASLTYVVAVTNYGPGASTGVNLTNILPAGMTYVSSSATVGTPLVSGGTITWNVGSLAVNAGAQLTITATAAATGVQLTSAVVTSTSSDANPSDDSASIAVTVGTAEPPQMSASLVNGNGEFQLSIVGAAIPTVIQASTNLSNWVPVYTNLPPFTFTDPNAASYPARFYRAVLGQ